MTSLVLLVGTFLTLPCVPRVVEAEFKDGLLIAYRRFVMEPITSSKLITDSVLSLHQLDNNIAIRLTALLNGVQEGGLR